MPLHALQQVQLLLGSLGLQHRHWCAGGSLMAQTHGGQGVEVHLDHACFLAGVLPASWANLTKLNELRISNAPNLTGGLPQEWATLRLQQLDLTNLSLSGQLTALSSIPSLAVVALRHMPNATLPAAGPGSLFTNTSLAELVIENVGGWVGTGLDANMPNSYPNISRLALVQLGMVGGIPTSWQSFQPQQLKDLDLSRNALNGTLPSWLASRVQSGSLNLGHNMFVGGFGQLYMS